MKTKLKSLLFLAVLVPFLFSCNEDPSVGAATITFGSASSKMVTEDGSLVISGSVVSEEGTTIESIIVTCTYVKDGQSSSTEVATMSDLTKEANNNYTFMFNEKTKGIASHLDDITGVKIVAKVKNGDESDKTWEIVPYSTGTTNLGDAQSFSWVRSGSGSANGLSQFGLVWNQNTSSVAIVKKDAATKFVELNAADWTGITTQEGLSDAIDAATDMAEYRGISVNASANYDVVLGVRSNNENYILHITRADVQSSSSGATITITGEYKN